MTNLTEQWNKGKLPEGDYYIKRRNGDMPYDNIDSHGVWRNSIDEDIIEVLAEVPSYEEWQAKLEENDKLKTENKWYSEQLHGWVDRAGDLEELLKECKLAIFDYPPYDLASDKIRLQIKINKVLGEE